VIRLRRIDHVCLRVSDLDEAVARWSVQFGLTEAGRTGGTARLRCGYEPYSLELSQGDEPGHDHTAFELHREVTLDAAEQHLERRAVEYARLPDALRFRDPDGNGIELVPYRPADGPFPDVARSTSTLRAFHPRKVGHVNVLSGDLAGGTSFYTEVLGMRITDTLGDAGVWFHVNADHHVMALVQTGAPHFHHLAFELVDWGELRVAFDHLAQHGRWLSWGPVRHGLGRNLCGYVRIPEEECLVELYCDMEQLEPDHEPRAWPDDAHSSNVWGILPPRSYFRFDAEAIAAERGQLEALGTPLT
jgi:catechol 2,3-dioxygenase-like lactoylglutathione lyase family enzyme